MVLSVKIAESGRSMSSFNLCNCLPIIGFSFSIRLTNEGVTLNRTASQIEHRNKKRIETTKKKISVAII